MAINLRKACERRAPRRFEDELDQIYALETPEPRVIRPASRPARPAFHVASKSFNPDLRPAAFPSLPLDGSQSHDCQGDDNGAREGCGAIGSEGMSRGQTPEDSLIVRLKLDKHEEGSQPVSLRDLVEREDSREAAVWSAKQQLCNVTSINSDQASRQYGFGYGTPLEKQCDIHSTLSILDEETNDMDNPEINHPAGVQKVEFSGLHPIVRCTIITNMYTDALKEGFQDVLFPIQRLLDISAESVIQALDVIEEASCDGDYPTCLSSPTMLENFLQARRFLIQQNWPRRFLKSVDLAKCTTDPEVEVQHPHAPKDVHNMPSADLVFFGRQKGRAEDGNLQNIRGSAPGRVRDRLKFRGCPFPAGATEPELQHLRISERQGQSLVREEQAASSSRTSQQHFNPQLVHSSPLTQSNVFPVSITALRQGPSTPISPDAPPYSTTLAPLRQMLPPTAPSSPSPEDLPSYIYGPLPSVEHSEAELLMMLGAPASAAIPQNASCSSSPPRGEESSTPATGLTLDDNEENCIIIPSARPTRLSQQQRLMIQTPPSTPTTMMETEPSSPSQQRQQRQQLLRQRPVLSSSSSSAMLHVFERNYHRHIQEQQAAQALTQVRSLREVLTTRGNDQKEEHGQQGGLPPPAASSTPMADNHQVHTASPGTAPSQPNSPGLYFPSSSAASRAESASSRPSSSSSSISTATTSFVTPPSSIPVAPMLSTITTATNATTAATAAAPATISRSQKPSFPNSGRKRNTSTPTSTTSITNNRRPRAAVHGQLALPSASGGERGTSSNNISHSISIGGRLHHQRGGGIVRSQLAMSNNGGLRKKSNSGGGGGGGAMAMASPQQLPLPSAPAPSPLGKVHLTAVPARSVDEGGDPVGVLAQETTASLRGGDGEGEGEEKRGGGEEEDEQQEGKRVEGGKMTEGKDPYGMFMKGVVEYAESD